MVSGSVVSAVSGHGNRNFETNQTHRDARRLYNDNEKVNSNRLLTSPHVFIGRGLSARVCGRTENRKRHGWDFGKYINFMKSYNDRSHLVRQGRNHRDSCSVAQRISVLGS